MLLPSLHCLDIEDLLDGDAPVIFCDTLGNNILKY